MRIAQTLSMLFTAWQLVVKRSLAHWRLLSSVIVGVLLASTIMAGMVIYFQALQDLALATTLGKYNTTDLDILTHSSRAPTTRAEYQKVSTRTNGEIDANISWLLKDRIRGGKSTTFFLTTPGNEPLASQGDQRSYFVFLPRLGVHTEVLAGTAPQEQALGASETHLELEALVSQATAESFGVTVGDQLSAVQNWQGVTQHVKVTVSGVFQKMDPADPYWHLDDEIFLKSSSLHQTAQFYISETTFLDVLGLKFPRMESRFAWALDVDTDLLNAGNTSATRANMGLMEERLKSDLQRYVQNTSLDGALAEYDRKLLFTKLQMFVVLILIAVVILYYVITLSALLVEEQRGEIAMLRSRGATSAQTLAVYVLQGATISVMAVVIAPLIAVTAVSFLGFTPAFSELTNNSRLPVSVSGGAYMMSALGGVLSFLALMVPAFDAVRIGVTRHWQEASRPASVSAVQKYYLDVLLLVGGIILLRQLSQQGSVAARDVLGEVAVNQLLLVMPALILVGAAMVLLRAFPLVMNLASRFLSPGLPPGLVIGLWQMARNPTHYARLSLLLILMSGLGIFAASFGGTLEVSFVDRVLYANGSEIRLEDVRLGNSGISRNWRRDIQRMPGVEVASPAFRGTGQDLTRLPGQRYQMLGVDSSNLGNVAWFRDDFAEAPIVDLLSALQADSPIENIVLPDNTRAVIVNVKPNRSHPSVILIVRLKDSNDRYFSYVMGNLESGSWESMESNLSNPVGPGGVSRALTPSRPLSLTSVSIYETNSNGLLQPGSILIESVQARLSTVEIVEIEGFADPTGWNVLRTTPETDADELEVSELAVEGDARSVARFTWSGGPPRLSRGIFPGPPSAPLPALASESFLNKTGHTVGDSIEVSVSGERIPVRLANSVSFFPTLDTINEEFLIADTNLLMQYANVGNSFGEVVPNEFWLATTGNQSEKSQLLDRLADGVPFDTGSIRDRDADLATFQLDPLVGAGWNALLFIAFGAILILSALGFLVHAYMSFQSRQLQFALLRTMGFSVRQLIALMSLEQALVIAVGMILGTWMGGRLGATIMPFLGHDERGSQVLPPFAIHVDWVNLAITYAVMGLVFTIIIAGVIWFIHRMSLQSVLRLGDG
ncbi:MAG: hypothetical protein QF898_04490 [SAR202 cluster bacterium]|jgi:hypothetical protein|nr:hypothetical protein [SAR202 cluster bacterium]MDP6512587.1 hypothetical protein [SAR202 cluster bacterium]MDP6714260.1 hypothetical protein [SAR202 cluster bacterium]|tara:strand:- start:1228 stop:4590 length:3363 start_codon:yes stop_codon:yes gene_type:complete